MSRPLTSCASVLRTCRRGLPNLYPSKRTQGPPFTASCLSNTYATQAPVPQQSQSTLHPPTQPPSPPTYSPKIEDLVKSISQLTLLEAAELVEALKCRLNITETAVPVQISAPVGISGAGADATNGHQQAAEPEKPKEKTTFNLTLTKIDATQKAKVIKEVKTIMPNMNLVEAKKFVESLPKLLKENGTKEEIEKLKQALESVGATVQLD